MRRAFSEGRQGFCRILPHGERSANVFMIDPLPRKLGSGAVSRVHCWLLGHYLLGTRLPWLGILGVASLARHPCRPRRDRTPARVTACTHLPLALLEDAHVKTVSLQHSAPVWAVHGHFDTGCFLTGSEDGYLPLSPAVCWYGCGLDSSTSCLVRSPSFACPVPCSLFGSHPSPPRPPPTVSDAWRPPTPTRNLHYSPLY